MGEIVAPVRWVHTGTGAGLPTWPRCRMTWTG